MLTRLFVCLCLGLLALTTLVTLVPARTIVIETKPDENKDAIYSGKVRVVYDGPRANGKISAYLIVRDQKTLPCYVLLSEGGDKIRAVVGEPADDTVSVEITGTAYTKNQPDGEQFLHMICKSAKKL